MAYAFESRPENYPNNAFTTWFSYKLEQKCELSSLPSGLYSYADIVKEINTKLKTKYTPQRLVEWLNGNERTVPDNVVNEFVNPDIFLVMRWFALKRGYSGESFPLEDFADVFKIPSKVTREK